MDVNDSTCSQQTFNTFTPEDNEVQFSLNSKVDDLECLLRSWNQETLIEHFKAENVSLAVLKVIKRHHIEKLLQKFDMGTLILFEHNLEEWRKSIGFPIVNYLTSPIPPSSPTPSFASNTSSVKTPYSRPSTPDKSSIITLSTILNENPKGIILLDYYKKFGKFEEEQRSSLITTIAQFFEKKNMPMSISTSYRIKKEILDRFPTEKLEFYRTSKRGKLYNKCSNMRTSFKAAVLQHVLPTPIKKAAGYS
ncbi:hypothetical protein FQR65_LT11482 [Abscondita terminalis]|nr:hypothetical protein FQR65_LT11482 [Abscondita terminalis]